MVGGWLLVIGRKSEPRFIMISRFAIITRIFDHGKSDNPINHSSDDLQLPFPPITIYFPRFLKSALVKFTTISPLAGTSTVLFAEPSSSCHAMTRARPAGTPAIE